ncbi:MAG: OmpA family protein [Chitinivibrionales bacterium]|nr:OmpA family protein [Chitinivibrionales bacterium]
MRKVRTFLISALFLSLCSPLNAVQKNAPVINRFGHTGLFYSHSAKTLRMGRLSVNAYTNWTADSDFMLLYDSTAFEGNLFMYNLVPAIGYGVTNFLDFSVSLPVYWDHIFPESKDSRLDGSYGDIEITGKFQYPPYPHSTIFEVAFLGGMSFPTGNDGEGIFPRHSYYLQQEEDTLDYSQLISVYTSTVPELDLKMLWTLDLNAINKASPVYVHVNFGSRFTFHADLENLFLLNLAFEYHPVGWLNLFTEFSGETRMSNVKDGFKLGEDPLRLSPGVSFTPPGGFYVTLGGDVSLTADSTTTLFRNTTGQFLETRAEPRWRVALSLGWAGFVLPQDEDADGLKDNVDRCPKDPEDFDNFEDSDGCPEEDNDNDGILDPKDKCQNEAEDKDGFEDEDGCPELDNDKDGIVDLEDDCPMVPEDLDGFEDEDGCQDSDNDQDAVPDSIDQCLNEPEDRDGFMDHDGCPELDNDEDGVPDSLDKCPDTKGVPENNGCPMEKPKPKEIKRGRVVLKGVNFEFNSAILTGDSYAILERVYESLHEWPEVRVEIRGHTDSIGSNRTNQNLSQKRAEAVREYLVSRGIEPSRLKAVGMGETDPIANNKSAEGRAMNRRVELHRID